nr:peptidoglycan-binding domain-containing protein [Pseudohalocynthiibacter aestuariivivens]
MRRNIPLLLMAVSLLSGCDAPLPGGAKEPALVQTLAEAPPGAAPGTCWGKVVTPAVIETVTDQIILQPAEVLADGTVVAPAVYKTETRQAIVQERKVTWFETPCAADLTPEFVSTLQRALMARNLYRGQITGMMDSRTRAAVRRYQKPEGLDSGILSLAAARQLGLVAVERG